MQIIRANPADADTLKQICVAAKAYWGYPADWMQRWSVVVWVTPAYIHDNTTYTAVEDDEIIGWYSLIEQGNVCLLDHLWVIPERIGTGVGRALFAHALDQARQAGAHRLELEAEPNAVGFYAHMGARQIRDIVSDMGRTLPIMAIDLETLEAGD